MKHTRFAIVTITAVFMSFLAMGQKVREISGSADILKDVKTLNIKYDYSNMEVGNKSEKEYISEKKDKYNSKEAGRGTKWEQEWIADRKNRFEPKFEELFNDNCDIKLGNYPNEKYTLIFKTVYTEPGFNVGVVRKNAYINGEAWIVATADQNTVLAKFKIDDCPGRTAFGTDFDNGLRIQEAYAMAGKGLAKYFRKNVD
jgi:hypothetical protein